MTDYTQKAQEQAEAIARASNSTRPVDSHGRIMCDRSDYLDAHCRTLEALDTERGEHKAALALSRANLENWKRALDERDTERTRADEAEKRERELLDLLQFAYDTLYEINPSNYDHDEVCRLNDASVEVISTIKPVLPQPEPDPLVAAIQYLDENPVRYDGPEAYSKRLTEALAKHGLSIVKGES